MEAYAKSILKTEQEAIPGSYFETLDILLSEPVLYEIWKKPRYAAASTNGLVHYGRNEEFGQDSSMLPLLKLGLDSYRRYSQPTGNARIIAGGFTNNSDLDPLAGIRKFQMARFNGHIKSRQVPDAGDKIAPTSSSSVMYTPPFAENHEADESVEGDRRRWI
ncbi:hypothetical protein FB45DRAFT_39885 [Roridomyces roridus]|uniref:Uncharacterized protein n=1 Tax=Roridomyces roridus TaxID=1738132 RepID=A0AAD7BR57_9AGAR|nr:hypothetical protein FB45DRAFT_39885 [Roridomyces roridus]